MGLGALMSMNCGEIISQVRLLALSEMSGVESTQRPALARETILATSPLSGQVANSASQSFDAHTSSWIH